MKRLLIAVVSISLMLVVTACSQAGGATTACSSFQGMSSGDQLATVQNMMKTFKQNMAQGDVGLTLGSVTAFCAVHSPSTQISGIYSG